MWAEGFIDSVNSKGQARLEPRSLLCLGIRVFTPFHMARNHRIGVGVGGLVHVVCGYRDEA